MQMTKYFVCCEQCFEAIAKKSTRAAKIWMDFCSECCQNGELLQIKNADSPEIRLLETNGFLVTSERPNTLVVKVLGHIMSEDNEHFFCSKEGNHD